MGCGRGWVLPLLLRETGGVDPWGDLTAFCFSDNLTGTAAGFLSGCRLFFLPHGDTHLGTDLSGGGPSKTGRGGGSCYMSNLVKLKTPSLNSGVTAQRLEMRRSERVGEAGSLCRRTLGQATEEC